MKKLCVVMVFILLLATFSSVPWMVTASSDSIPPEWRNQGQTKTTIQPGESISLYAQGKDNIGSIFDMECIRVRIFDSGGRRHIINILDR